jgi:predicted Ser/Thr protein kinase
VREGCLDPDVIDGLLAGRLEGDALERAETHLDACRDCRQLVSELARHGSVATAETLTEHSLPRRADTGHLKPGERVDRYVIVRRIGSGGMGVVLLAHDPELERHVVIKLLRSELIQGSPEDRDRLLREAQAMAKVSHANVVPIYDVGVHAGRVFLAMEYIDGWDLAAWLRESPREVADVLAVFLAAGRGLAAAHRAGLVHRDFKPHNVMIGRAGEVKVTDFGLARAQHSHLPAPDPAPAPAPRTTPSGELLQSPLTRTGMLVGTPAYMAPEQILGENVDARSDQFSFCVALFEALYGVRPFHGRTPEEQFESTLKGNVEIPARAGVPAHVPGVLRRGLAVSPGTRFATMEDLLGELAPRRARRRSWLVAAVAGVVLAGAGGGAAVLASRDRPAAAPAGNSLEPVLDAWQAARACLVGARPAVRDLTTAVAARDLVLPDGESCDAALAQLRDRAAAATAEAGLRAGVQDVIAAYRVHHSNIGAGNLWERLDSGDQLPVAIATVDSMLGRFRAPPAPALESVATIHPEAVIDIEPPPDERDEDMEEPINTFVAERDGQILVRTQRGRTAVVTWMYDFAKLSPAGQTWSPTHRWHADANGRISAGGTTLAPSGEVIAALGDGDRRAVVYKTDAWYVARSLDRGRRWTKERLPAAGDAAHTAVPLADRAELAWWADGQLHWLAVTAADASERVTPSAKPVGTCTTGALWLLVPDGADVVVRRADRDPAGRLRGAAKALVCSADRVLVTAGADDYACGAACNKLPFVPRAHVRASGAAIVGGAIVRYALHPTVNLLAVWRDAGPPSYVMPGDDMIRGIVDNGSGRAMLYVVADRGEVATAALP